MRRRAAGRLRCQRRPLLDAEAVLLVDDDEAEVGELHGLLEQRVGADDDARLPRRRLEQRPLAGRGRQRAGQQRDPRRVLGAAEHPAAREVTEHRGQRAVVLLGEHLGGGEQGRLRTGVDHAQHGPQRDDRLAGADLALEQPVHRVLGGEVVEDLRLDALLALGELEGHARVEGVEQPARTAPSGASPRRRAARDAAGRAPPGRRRPRRSLQPLLGGAGLPVVRRPVDPADREVALDEALLLRGPRAAAGRPPRSTTSSTVRTARSIFAEVIFP